MLDDENAHRLVVVAKKAWLAVVRKLKAPMTKNISVFWSPCCAMVMLCFDLLSARWYGVVISNVWSATAAMVVGRCFGRRRESFARGKGDWRHQCFLSARLCARQWNRCAIPHGERPHKKQKSKFGRPAGWSASGWLLRLLVCVNACRAKQHNTFVTTEDHGLERRSTAGAGGQTTRYVRRINETIILFCTPGRSFLVWPATAAAAASEEERTCYPCLKIKNSILKRRVEEHLNITWGTQSVAEASSQPATAWLRFDCSLRAFSFLIHCQRLHFFLIPISGRPARRRACSVGRGWAILNYSYAPPRLLYIAATDNRVL